MKFIKSFVCLLSLIFVPNLARATLIDFDTITGVGGTLAAR